MLPQSCISNLLAIFNEYKSSVPSDVNCVRQLVVWLEDHKIRHYKIEDRSALKQISDSKWPNTFKKYLQDLNCPFAAQNLSSVIDWLLGLAIQFEFSDNGKFLNFAKLLLYLAATGCCPDLAALIVVVVEDRDDVTSNYKLL